MSNELRISAVENLDTSGVFVKFQDSSTDPIFPSSPFEMDEKHQIIHIPTMDGPGIVQSKTNDYRIFEITLPILTNLNYDYLIEGLEDMLYAESGLSYHIGTISAYNYPHYFTYEHENIRSLPVRILNVQKRRIPNSNSLNIFDLIITMQKVYEP